MAGRRLPSPLSCLEEPRTRIFPLAHSASSPWGSTNFSVSCSLMFSPWQPKLDRMEGDMLVPLCEAGCSSEAASCFQRKGNK
jgi:hypothetical protein